MSASTLDRRRAPARAWTWRLAAAACGVATEATAQSAADATAASAVEAFSAHPAETAALVVAALIIGGFLARMLFRRAPATVGPPGRAARRPSDAEPPGMIFRGEAPTRAGAPDARRAAATHEPPRAPSRTDADAQRVFDYFEDSFDVRERTADAVIGYLERLGGAIERQGGRLARAEAEIERLVAEKAAREVEKRAGVDAPAASGAAPALRFAMEGVRTARVAMQQLRARADDAFAALATDAELEDVLRRVAALQSAHSDGGPIDPSIVSDPWPHALWRAHLLLDAYFPNDGAWAELRDGVAAASAGLRRALREVGVIVGHVQLLRPYAPLAGENWSASMGAVGDLDVVRAALDHAPPGMVVDVETFGYVDRVRGVAAKARLIVDGGGA